MANSADWAYNESTGYGYVYVNGVLVITFRVGAGGYYTGYRAQLAATRLNDDVFSDSDRDLDFITPGWSGDYVVLSAQVRRGGGTTYFYEDNHPPINENLYSRSVNLICTATTNDATSYGTTQAALALTWARNIRAALSSSDLNCLGTQVKSSRQLVFPTGNYSGNRSVAATHYGAGELVMNPMTSNGEIFHTCDLTIAADLNIIPRNRWVKVTYGSKSIIARCNDTAPSGTVDLSYGGVSQALGYPGGGNVTISTP
ncbi:hypothetical protein Psfp_02071 [Pelotomaculum sp. FP]|uniref:hypothetical protein n=1 Tax=Pelotomaculum sp. FP TaxID=261474 RepID=UPI001065CDA9|nr:hypothetical protein [Pelotomaculum sp. FP]TEB15576.1 hypothetical protein Psfp_02071 [Pelotomaculum sp. FP]